MADATYIVELYDEEYQIQASGPVEASHLALQEADVANLPEEDAYDIEERPDGWEVLGFYQECGEGCCGGTHILGVRLA